MYNSIPHESGWKSVFISTLWNCCNDAPQYSLQITRMWPIQLRATHPMHIKLTHQQTMKLKFLENVTIYVGSPLKMFTSSNTIYVALKQLYWIVFFALQSDDISYVREFILYGDWHLTGLWLVSAPTESMGGSFTRVTMHKCDTCTDETSDS